MTPATQLREVERRSVENIPETMRIFMVCEPAEFGSFKYVKGLIEYLCSHGIQIDYAYSDVRRCCDLDELITYVESRGGLTLNLHVGEAPSISDFSALFKLLKQIRKGNYDVVHAHCSKAGALVRLIRLVRLPCRVIYTPHAYYGTGKTPSLSVAFFNMIETGLGHIGTTILASDGEREFALKRLGIPKKRIRQIPNGIPCDSYAPASPEKRRFARAQLGLPADAFVFGTIARYSFQKDPVTLYQALFPLLQEHPDVWFLHIGDGEMWEAVTALGNSERILRLKSLKPIQLFYDAIDVFVLSSRYEGHALAVLEAMASNKPMILSECPGNLDYKECGLNRIDWVKLENPDGLLQAMSAQHDRHLLACNHRDVALAKFSDEVCYGQVLAEYRRTLSTQTIKRNTGRKPA